MTRGARPTDPPDTFGFRWGQLDVTRIGDFRGQKCIEVATDFGNVTIYVSPTGRSIRVFRDNDTEMTA